MNEQMAETMEWQARCRDLETSLEFVREERDLARAALNHQQNENRELHALISRLRLHIAQGVEL